MNMSQTVRIMRSVAIATYKEWMAYRVSMAISLITGPIFFLVQYFIWNAVFTVREEVNGMTLEQILFYYGIVAMINYVTFDFSDWENQQLIHTGKFVTFMLRPVSHRYYAFCQKVGHRTLAFWMECIPIFFLFHYLFGITLIPKFIGWTVVSLMLSFVMVFLVNYCIGLCAFWLTRAEGVRRMFILLRDVSAGVFLPLSFFPEIIQQILFFLPFQFITYVPTQVFLGQYELAGHTLQIPQIVGMQLLAVCVMWGISEMLWRVGLKKFTGAGT